MAPPDVEASTSTMKDFCGSGWTRSGADVKAFWRVFMTEVASAFRRETWAWLSGGWSMVQ